MNDVKTKPSVSQAVEGSGQRARRLRDATLALAARVMIRALAGLPLRLAQRIGASAGVLAWRMGSRAAEVTRINLRACFPEMPEQELERLGRASLIETGKLAAELGMVWHWPERHWRGAIASVEGVALIEAALAEGRGVLMLSPHFGNWEMLSLYLGERYGMTALYDPPRIAGLEAPLREARMRSGSHLVPADASGLRALYRALRKGRVAGLLPDQVPEREAGIHAPFFGRSALTMTLVHRLIRDSHPQVLLASAQRLEGGAFVLRFECFLQGADPEIDDLALATALNRGIERLIRRSPAQYQWEYKRFKRPPDGVARLY